MDDKPTKKSQQSNNKNKLAGIRQNDVASQQSSLRKGEAGIDCCSLGPALDALFSLIFPRKEHIMTALESVSTVDMTPQKATLTISTAADQPAIENCNPPPRGPASKRPGLHKDDVLLYMMSLVTPNEGRPEELDPLAPPNRCFVKKFEL
jgi:hypothetical protein